MAILTFTTPAKPRIAITLGDQAGVGPELVAKLLSNQTNLQKADIVLLADRSEFDAALLAAGGLKVPIADVAGPHGIQILDDSSASSTPIKLCEASEQGGARCMYQFHRGIQLWREGAIDAMVFAPLNKTSLKKAGMTEEDELRWFAKQLKFEGMTSEINIAGSELWTARVTSHVGIEKVAGMITKESVLKAIELLNRLRWESGINSPRLAVCALNPHNGENGSFGRQEIDAIAPAVAIAQQSGINVQGPFPCDTIFLKRKMFDGIVTMYHDQGQIALKLLSFEGGVTVQGGLPMIIATPAHGTALDIAGKGIASVVSTQAAFDVAFTMASRRLLKRAGQVELSYTESLAATVDEKFVSSVEVMELPSCC